MDGQLTTHHPDTYPTHLTSVSNIETWTWSAILEDMLFAKPEQWLSLNLLNPTESEIW